MRKLSGFYKWLVFVLGVALPLVTMFNVMVYPLDPWIFYTLHLSIASTMVFFLIPMRKEDKGKQSNPQLIDILLSLASWAVTVYTLIELDGLIYRAGASPTQLDIIFGLVLIITVLEACRRAAGMAFVIVAVVAMAYALFGGLIPGIMGHGGYSLARTVSFIFSPEGVFGSTIRASATYAVLFITLGAFLKVSGGADFFHDFAMAVSGHTRGGPGKVAVLASTLFGTISGHAAGNVATTGTFTIPLMKRIGYKPAFAGAIEAAASTGGQILPPVMGTVAFVMVEMTGITYTSLIVAAALPAIFYYLAVYFMVDFEAMNLNLMGLPREQLPSLGQSLKLGVSFVISITFLLYMLFGAGSSVTRAAIYTLGVIVLVSWFTQNKVTLNKILEALYNGGEGTMRLAPLTAAAGIVIGVVSLTGIGIRLGQFIIMLAGGKLFLILLMAMILSAILGMGMSTVPAYVIAAAVVAPALVQAGVPVMAAHLFVLYYACLSTITPPVAISSFTAAAIADGDPMETGFHAVKLAISGFIVPFLFVYRPPLLAQGTTFEIVYTAVITLIAVYALSRGLQYRKISILERVLMVAGAAVLLFPAYDLVGIILIFGGYLLTVYQKYVKGRKTVNAQ